jgi:hypothetical protein
MQQTFPQWLHDQQGRGDVVGDFADQVAGLSDLPEHGDRAIFEGYFENSLAEDRASFERAWGEFESVH